MKVSANTFYQSLVDVVNNNKGDNLAFVFNDKAYTFKELLYAIDVCEKELLSIGLKKGDHIGVLGYNSDNWFITFMAILKIGAVASLFSYSMDPDALIELMKLTEITYLAYSNNSILDKDKSSFDKMLQDMSLTKDKLYDFRPDTIDFKEKIKSVNDYDHNYKDLDIETAKKDTFIYYFYIRYYIDSKGLFTFTIRIFMRCKKL